MKKYILLLLLAVCTVLAFCSCSCDETENEYSQGLLYTLNDDGTYTVSGIGSCKDTDIKIPPTHEDKAVTRIDECAFYMSGTLKSVWIPNSVTSIGDCAFYYCSSLQRVEAREGLTHIGFSVFEGCTNLKSVEIPNSVTSVEHGAFYGCTSLQYNSYDNCLYLGNYENPYFLLVESSQKDIESCVIHEDTRIINTYAFQNCYYLKDVYVPSGVVSIGYCAFDGCVSLKGNVDDYGLYLGNEENPYVVLYAAKSKEIFSYDIPRGTKVIYNNAFENCKIIRSIVIGENVTSIGNYAFSGCDLLKSVVMGDSVINIGKEAFSSCSYLESVELGKSVTSIGDHAFFGCQSLKSIVIPVSVARMGTSVFEHCESLAINCEAKEKPIGWKSNWNNSNFPVVWGYTGN